MSMPEMTQSQGAGPSPVPGAGTGNGYGAYSAGVGSDPDFDSHTSDTSGFDGSDDGDAHQSYDANGSGGDNDGGGGGPDSAALQQQGAGAGTGDNLPWHKDPRWIEWQEQRKQLDAFAPLIEELSQQGIRSAQDAYNLLAQQQQEAQIATRRAELQNSVELGEITEELANRLLQAEQAQMSLARSQQVITRQLTDQAIHSVRTSILPDMTPEVERHLRSLPPDQVQAQAQLIKAQSDLIVKQAVAQYQAQKAKDASVRTPERSGGTAPPIPQGGSGGNQNAADAVLGQVPAWKRPWSSLFPDPRGTS